MTGFSLKKKRALKVLVWLMLGQEAIAFIASIHFLLAFAALAYATVIILTLLFLVKLSAEKQM
jgi:hypothetical protein